MIISSGFPPFSPASILPERPLEPPEKTCPVCPVCGDECNYFHMGWDGNIVGCDKCVDVVDAWEDMDNDNL